VAAPALALLIATSTLLSTSVARADLTACIASSEQSLALRHAGKLHDARKELALCSAQACPEELRVECVKRMEALNAAMPSLVIGAKDGAGNDLLAASVTVDSVKVAGALDGRPIEVDPGEHVVRVEVTGLPASERKLVIGEGEKTRHERFVLGEVIAPRRVISAEPREAELAPYWGTQRKAAVAVGVTGVVAIGVGVTFGLLSSTEWSSSKSAIAAQASCASGSACPAHATAVSDHNSAVTDATVSTIALGVGAAFVAAGVVTWLTSPRDRATPSSRTGELHLVPSGGPGGGSLTIVGTF
jgi:hypothetical protein